MVVIKADNSGKVGNKGVSLPSTIVESSSEGTNDVTTEDGGKTTHESGLSTSRVSGNTDDDRDLAFSESHVKVRGGGDAGTKLVGGHECRRGESGSGSESSGESDELHGV
mmetsp:Transcript_14464/g.20393  ORF Transcript_14464/g.20393 Transcript_14464/m.20393 type:complete len:110 (-) Transcript_14464:55-384(-)